MFKKEIKKITKGIIIGFIILIGTAGVYAANSTIKTYISNFSASDSEIGKLINGFFDGQGYINTEFVKDLSLTGGKLANNSIGETQIEDVFIANDSIKLGGEVANNYQKKLTNPNFCSGDYAIQTISQNGTVTCIDTDGGGFGGGMLGDNLGNHKATENIQLKDNYLSNDGGNEGIRISNSGNVGIGTNNPTQKLDVNGGIIKVNNAGKYTTYGNENAAYSHFYTNSDSGYYFNKRVLVDSGQIGSYNEDLQLQASGDTKVTVKTNGNVGIGTNNPDVKLDIRGGNIGLEGNRGFSIGQWESNIPDSTPDAQLVLDGAHNQGYNLGTKLLIRGSDNESNTKAISVVDENSNELFSIKTQPVNYGQLYFKGNVGIGTTAPTQKLDVNGNMRLRSRYLQFGDGKQSIFGDSATAFYVGSNHDTVTQMILRDKQDKIYGRVYGDGNGAYFGLLDGDGQWSYLAAKDNYTSFRINNSEKMRIRSDGRVGIGTSSPAQQLDVNGTIQGKYLTLKPQWGSHEGGELQLQGAPGYSNIQIDSYDGNLRVHSLAGGKYMEIIGGSGIKAPAFIYSSDKRLKKDIKTLDKSLEKINKMRGVRFNWKKDNKKEIGLIAQEVEEVYPDLVTTNDNGMKGVKYGNIVAILIEGVKELYNKVVGNSDEIEKLKAENIELKNRLELLEGKINKLVK